MDDATSSNAKSVARPFKCSECSRGFTRQENLKRHIHTHHKGLSGRTFQCPQCNALFARPDLRKRHVDNCHVQLPQEPPQDGIPISSVASPTMSTWLETLMLAPVPATKARSEVPSSFQDDTPSDLKCIGAFFSEFHQNFPILHEGTFDAMTTPAPLQNAIIAIGSLYCDSGRTAKSRKALFDAALKSLQAYVEQNRSRYQETWVIQTFLLLEYFGIYDESEGGFAKAQQIHRDLVDAMRMLQMSHDGALRIQFEQDSSEEPDDGNNFAPGDSSSENLEIKWREFAKKEARKRCIYSLYLLDSHMSILYNQRPMLSSLEIKYDLPCCEDSWLAKSATVWNTCRRQHFTAVTDYDYYNLDSPVAQGFFYEVSQSLLHSEGMKRHPERLRLLPASPFTAVILVTQLQMMTRELTHVSCLLRRPIAQASTVSVLTEKQLLQISHALKIIAELVPARKMTTDCYGMDNTTRAGENSLLWHSFWTLWHYSSITLSRPDPMLVSGVVECSLIGAISTACELAQSRPIDAENISGDRDVFRILENLDFMFDNLSPMKYVTSSLPKTPFDTMLSFTIALEAWKLIRLNMNRAQEAANRGSRSNPHKYILESLMSPAKEDQDLQELENVFNGISGNSMETSTAGTLWSANGAVNVGAELGGVSQGTQLMRSETIFLDWITRVFEGSRTWHVGKLVAQQVAKCRSQNGGITSLDRIFVT
ncbi:fungal-specific transcription factor domain-containing protein [Leptodontidium sp. 2 PMI_412]|nr:fungal-specific transcription factor domain-containing protein [Leptodontidium sp. 2 PMI_412]